MSAKHHLAHDCLLSDSAILYSDDAFRPIDDHDIVGKGED